MSAPWLRPSDAGRLSRSLTCARAYKRVWGVNVAWLRLGTWQPGGALVFGADTRKRSCCGGQNTVCVRAWSACRAPGKHWGGVRGRADAQVRDGDVFGVGSYRSAEWHAAMSRLHCQLRASASNAISWSVNGPCSCGASVTSSGSTLRSCRCCLVVESQAQIDLNKLEHRHSRRRLKPTGSNYGRQQQYAAVS
jgi:hypothetical protein